MTMTNSGSAYNGDYIKVLYQVFGVGNDVIDQGSAALEVGIRTTRAIPVLSQTANPIGAYTTGAPGAVTVTTTYAERSLTPQKAMLYEEFLPDTWQDIWDEWSAKGDFTNLMMDPKFLRAVLELYQDGQGAQFAANFWQGNTGGALPTNLFNGIITRAAADADVIDVTNVGVIVKGNVIAVVEGMYNAMPAKFLNDPNWAIHMNSVDYKLLQAANVDAKKSTTGVLSTAVEELFLNKRIKHYSSLPKNSMVGAKGTTDRKTSNLFMGMYFDPNKEKPRLDYTLNNGRTMFIRIDYELDANYRSGGEIVLYQGS